MIWTYYDTGTGRVMGRRTGRGSAISMGRVGMIEGDWLGFWIDPENKTPSPLEGMSISVAAGEITGLPEGSTVSCRGRSTTASGAVAIVGAYPETVTVTVEHPRYRPETVTVECTATASHPDVLTIEQDVRDLRAKAYPSIGDQLDALWKGGPDAEAMKAAVLAVKANLPK